MSRRNPKCDDQNKFQITMFCGKAVVPAGYSGFLPHFQMTSHEHDRKSETRN